MYTGTGINTRLTVPVLVLVLLILQGCADMKGIVRDTHGTLMTLMTLTELDQVENADQLYVVEARIMDSCKPILECARIRVEGEDIPIFTMLDMFFSYEGCRRTVTAAREQLAQLNLSGPAPR